MLSIDVAAERARTPGCITGHHFNAAGAALPTSETVSAVTGHLYREAMIGGYEAAQEAKPRLDAVYHAAAAVIGARAEQVALVESATAGWQRAILALRLRPGDRVLAARSSYVSSALQLLALERESGVRVEVLNADAQGRVDLDELARTLRDGPAALVTAGHMPTTAGLVEPARELGALCREHGVPFLLDATQSVGQLPVDVGEIGCDLLVTTGRKFLRGPRGTGLLYVGLPWLQPVAPDVRGSRWIAERDWVPVADATRFELWEAAHALRLGLGAALTDLQGLGVKQVSAHLAATGASLRQALLGVPGVAVTDPPAAAGSVVTFTVAGYSAAEAQAALAERQVHVTSVPAAHGRWDLASRGISAVVRASAHIYNDHQDIAALGEAVREIALRRGKALGRTAARPGNGSHETADVVVAGLGIHGSAAVYHLARRGARVIGLEQFAPGHDRGSSHGATRMIRRAYPSQVWDGLVEAAYAGWAGLAEAAGREFITTTGGLYAHPAAHDTALRGPGCTEIDWLEAREAAPGLRVPDGYLVTRDPAAGVIDATAAWHCQLELARTAGAEIREQTPLVEFEPAGEGVRVQTPHGVIVAGRLVVAAGPWTARLLPGLIPDLRVIRIVNATFGPGGQAPAPVFSLELPPGLVYGVPGSDGSLKVGLDTGEPCDPDAARKPATRADLSLLREIVAQYVPAAGTLREHVTCLYTMTDDRRFVVGPLPDMPQLIVVSACSGHGFKFAPALGAAVADFAAGLSRDDLAFISPARRQLRMAAR